MLEGLFGNKNTEKILLSLIHYGETFVSAIAKDFKTAENPIRGQLEKLELAGIVISKTRGKTRLYTFNPKNPYTSSVKQLVMVLYKAIPLREREKIFISQDKPRRRGKPVL